MKIEMVKKKITTFTSVGRKECRFTESNRSDFKNWLRLLLYNVQLEFRNRRFWAGSCESDHARLSCCSFECTIPIRWFLRFLWMNIDHIHKRRDRTAVFRVYFVAIVVEITEPQIVLEVWFVFVVAFCRLRLKEVERERKRKKRELCKTTCSSQFALRLIFLRSKAYGANLTVYVFLWDWIEKLSKIIGNCKMEQMFLIRLSCLHIFCFRNYFNLPLLIEWFSIYAGSVERSYASNCGYCKLLYTW